MKIISKNHRVNSVFTTRRFKAEQRSELRRIILPRFYENKPDHFFGIQNAISTKVSKSLDLKGVLQVLLRLKYNGGKSSRITDYVGKTIINVTWSPVWFRVSESVAFSIKSKLMEELK